MSKALANLNTERVVGHFTQGELDTIKATIAKGTSNEQFALFVQTCVATGLNPFLNQVYCIVYNGKDGPVMSIQIAVEGIVALAKKHPGYKGFIASEVKENDEFEIDVVSGEPKHRITSMLRGKTIGAYCVAYREGAPNIAVIITNDQVEHLLKGRNGDMWKNYFDDMIVKHAVKRAFKRQFGIEVAEDEYVQGADAVPEYKEPQRKEVGPEVEGEPDQDTTSDKEQKSESSDLMKDITALFNKLGHTTKEKRGEYAKEKLKKEIAKFTESDYVKLKKLLEVEVQQSEQIDEQLELLP